MFKIGIDEAGRGPWLGPVVACSLTFDSQNMPSKDFLQTITDSKKLTDKKRKEIFDTLIFLSTGEKPQVFFGVGVVDNFLIDEINIKQANKEAMRRSLIELLRKIQKPHPSPLLPGEGNISGVLVDGNDNYVFEELEKKPIYIIGGDTKVLEIGAASIIAKVFRDELIETYAKIYPDVGLENHKGYGTKKHRDYLSDKSKVTGIHRVSYKPVKKILEQKPKLLLHICCGPDATVPIMDLKKEYEVVCFWYDPNIQPKREYIKRLKAFVKVCEIEGVEWIEGEYDVTHFLNEIKGLEHTSERGEKCEKCYDMRLKRTAKEAQKIGIKYWTSTLLTSPHKDIEKMFEIGDKYSGQPQGIAPTGTNARGGLVPTQKLEFLKIAFRKNNGFLRSVEYCKMHKIYRQNYCGCIYSDTFDGENFSG